MERIIFDASGNPEMPALILMTKGGRRIGMLNNFTDFHISSSLNDVDEISFTLHKYTNGTLGAEKSEYKYWNDVKDFRVIYIPGWKQYFEISVSLDDESDVTKTVIGAAWQETELSHINIYDTEINTENDILRSDYEPTILYNPNQAKASLLNRLLSDKCPHYKILHVDSSIAKLQRTFSFDDISIYDAFMEIAEEMHCLFVFGEQSEDTFMRTISVYDLESNCEDCGYRGEFEYRCPKCGSENIRAGYGEDTQIFISKENLGEDINFETDVNSVNNCFRLEAGDDLMTAAVINCNPSGSQYIWYFTDEMKNDMSDSLVGKLDSYDEKYEYYQTGYTADIDASIVRQYNQLIEKYKAYNPELSKISLPVKGFRQLINLYYDVIDFYGYLYNSLLPGVDTENTTAQEQAALLTSKNLSPVAVQNTDYISLATANSSITAYAKVIIDSARYKIKVKNSSLNGVKWTGNFIVESYYDEEDTAESSTITVTFNDNYEEFLRQKIEKALAKSNDENFSIAGLFNLNNSRFAAELKKYSYTHLQILADACQSCLDILIEQGAGDDSADDTESNVYENIYIPFYEKMNLISREITVRESEIHILNGVTDEYGDVTSKGIRNYIEEIREHILSELDFQTFIGNDWKELSSFRRESTWSNSNYTSEGLTNHELFENASHFLEAAAKEIYKSAELQHTISSTLKNLLVIKDFSSIVEHFKCGNWVRIEVDGQIYKLRLIHFEIDYGDMTHIDVEFSDVTKKYGAVSDIDSILSQSKSIAKSYSSTKRQAQQGSDSKNVVDNWFTNGLNATTVKIVSSDNQDIVYDKHGLLFRKYDEVTDSYDDIQLKIVNSTIAVTDDNWKTLKTAVGSFYYVDPQTGKLTPGYGINAEALVGRLMLGESLGIYAQNNSLRFDKDGLNITNGVNTFAVNPNDEKLFAISNGTEELLWVDENGKLYVKGNGAHLDISANDTTEALTLEVNKKVNESDFGTKIIQNYDSVQIAWNGISKYIKFINGELRIYEDNSAQDDSLLMKLAYNGAWYYNTGSRIGKIGTNNYSDYPDFKGLVFDLEYDAGYMCWAAKEDPNGSYIVQMVYFNRDHALGERGLHFSCPAYIDNSAYISDDVRTIRYSDGAGGLYSPNNTVIISGRTASIRGIRTDNSILAFECDGLNQKYILKNSSKNINNCLFDCYNDIDLHNFSILNQSDARLKTNISETKVEALEMLNKIELKQFDWIQDGSHEDIGIIAQQLQEIIPELVMENTSNGKLSIKENKFVPYLIKAIQELYGLIKQNPDNSARTLMFQSDPEDIWKDPYSVEEKKAFAKSISLPEFQQETECVKTPMQLP